MTYEFWVRVPMERNIVIDELVSSVNDILYELDIIQISVKDFGIFPYMNTSWG